MLHNICREISFETSWIMDRQFIRTSLSAWIILLSNFFNGFKFLTVLIKRVIADYWVLSITLVDSCKRLSHCGNMSSLTHLGLRRDGGQCSRWCTTFTKTDLLRTNVTPALSSSDSFPFVFTNPGFYHNFALLSSLMPYIIIDCCVIWICIDCT